MKIHHIGYLVKDMREALKEFSQLGFTAGTVVRDELRGSDICFIRNGEYYVELISPYCENSTVSGLIKKYKNSPYHICYISSHFEKDIEEFVSKGYVQIGEPQEAPAIDGRRVVFLMNGNIGMIEIVEEISNEL
ncbi:MAG: VOC family protein [Alistipes sp.]|nr:VOC family protein [Alistipes sp.]